MQYTEVNTAKYKTLLQQAVLVVQYTDANTAKHSTLLHQAVVQCTEVNTALEEKTPDRQFHHYYSTHTKYLS